MNAHDLFTANLPPIERAISVVCRRAGVFGADEEDFASHVKLSLIESDCEALRRWEGRSSLESYLTVVISRMLSDARTQARGRFRASTEAQRLGTVGVLLEKLVLRDGRSLEEAMPHLRAVDPQATPESMAGLLRRLPERTVRPKSIDLEEAGDAVAGGEPADARALASDVRRLAERAERTLRDALGALAPEDRSLIRFHFGEEMTLAEISRVLRVPQRPLYRRLESLLRQFRGALASAGIDRGAAADLVGGDEEPIDFGLREVEKRAASPVNRMEES